MIHRITYKIRHAGGKRFEFLISGSVARDEFFVHAAGAHRAPFIVVAAEPERGEVCARVVFIDFFRRQVAVPVENRHFFRRLKHLFCRLIEEQEILIHEFS